MIQNGQANYILVVGQDEHITGEIEQAAGELGYMTLTVSTAQEACDSIIAGNYYFGVTFARIYCQELEGAWYSVAAQAKEYQSRMVLLTNDPGERAQAKILGVGEYSNPQMNNLGEAVAVQLTIPNKIIERERRRL